MIVQREGIVESGEWRVMKELESRCTRRLLKFKSDANTNVAEEKKFRYSNLVYLVVAVLQLIQWNGNMDVNMDVNMDGNMNMMNLLRLGLPSGLELKMNRALHLMR